LQIDTGTRCVTTPCPSSRWQTVGNAGAACANPDALGYHPEACVALHSNEAKSS